jgi:hypothetical protein
LGLDCNPLDIIDTVGVFKEAVDQVGKKIQITIKNSIKFARVTRLCNFSLIGLLL